MTDKDSAELHDLDPYGYEFYRQLLDMIYNAGAKGEDHYKLKDQVDKYIVNFVTGHTAAQVAEAERDT